METKMIRPVAKRAYIALAMYQELTPAAIVDFGVDSDDHLMALQTAVENGLTAEKLDEILGNGKKIQLAIAEFAPDYADIIFQTSYDKLGYND